MGTTSYSNHNTRNDLLFSKLPSEWIVTFLSEWIDIRDVAKLDVAMTMHSQRAGFLQILNEMRSTFINRKYDFDSFRMLHWLSYRRIYVEDIELETYGKCQQGEHRDRLKTDQLKDFSMVSLRTLVLHDVDDLGMFYSIRNCPRLQSIEINRYEYSKDNIVQTDVGLHRIAGLCPVLEHFSLNGNGVSQTGYALTVFFRGSRSLKTVKLTGNVFKDFSAFDIECLRPFGHLFEALTFPSRYPTSSSSPPTGTNLIYILRSKYSLTTCICVC